jgi:hypothetical protein
MMCRRKWTGEGILNEVMGNGNDGALWCGDDDGSETVDEW